MRKDLKLLMRAIEPQVIGLLIAHGYIKSESTKFSNMVLTSKGKEATGFQDPILTSEWLKTWRLKWPPEARASENVIREKLNRFLLEVDVTLTEISQATDRWLAQKEYPYCGHSRHFFYKLEHDGEFSRCYEMIEIIRDEKTSVADDEITVM